MSNSETAHGTIPEPTEGDCTVATAILGGVQPHQAVAQLLAEVRWLRNLTHPTSAPEANDGERERLERE